MATHPANKYHLKEVHQEIDYLDRKISYARTLEKFDSEAAREAALKKLRLKRDPLVKAALDLASKGVEWDAKDLPRSFAKTEAAAPSDAAPAAADAVPNAQ
jgi:heme oxygenase